MNPYSIAYAVGYFYGRSRGYIPTGSDLPQEDEALMLNQGFNAGFEAGQRDYQAIDLSKQAVSEPVEAQ
jgi:hypothetical protein